MKNVIDCDAVFEILTKAPFPGGTRDDDDVESHLQVCHDCRCLAEALRPAVGLFRESLDHDGSLPQYAGRLAELPAVSPEGRTAALKPRTAFIIAGIAAGVMFWLSATGGNGRRSEGTGSSASAALTPDAEGFATLCALRLPAECVTRHAQQQRSAFASDLFADWIPKESLAFHCCTECHRTGGTGPASARALRALDTACSACHRMPEMSTACNDSLQSERLMQQGFWG